MNTDIEVLSISPHALRAMEAEANDRLESETGGILMGFWAPIGSEIVVTEIIGPGPQAQHGRTYFYPDDAFQEAEVARIYSASGRRHTYLGDWHTHPGSKKAALSWQDRRTLRKICTHPEARAPKAIMLVLAGNHTAWLPAAWCGRSSRLLAFLPRLEASRLEVRIGLWKGC